MAPCTFFHSGDSKTNSLLRGQAPKAPEFFCAVKTGIRVGTHLEHAKGPDSGFGLRCRALQGASLLKDRQFAHLNSARLVLGPYSKT